MSQPTEPTASPASPESTGPAPDRVVAEDLVEEVSIDGMCGVY